MWMRTLAYLALQRKHKEGNLNESNFVRDCNVQLFWLCSRSAFDSWVNLSVAKSFYPHPSGQPLQQRFMPESSRQVHTLFTSTKCATFSVKLFWMTDQFGLPCGWKMIFPCNIVVRFFCYKQIFVVNACRFQISIWSSYISDVFEKKKGGGIFFWLQNCMENTGI